MASNTTLVLRNDGYSFEKLYYQAICLGEIHKAETLYARYSKENTPTFWRDAFRLSGLQETVLMSAIINSLNMPFGSYVFTRLDDEVIEISPWLYAEEASKRALIEALNEETADAESLRAFARTMNLTADFLSWLKEYTAKAESAHA